jgi:hypothetical protein
MVLPFAGIAVEILLVWLTYVDRLYAAICLAALSLSGAIALSYFELSRHFVGYKWRLA